MPFARVFPGLLLLFSVLTDVLALDVATLRDPRPTHWSLDHSNRLTQETLNALDDLGRRVRSDTGHELVVVVVTSTEGENQRGFGTRLFNHWEIGNRARHDGVLLFVALGDRRVEFILGDGIDENRHVAISQEIVDQDIVPLFRRGDPDSAVVAGARAAARRLLGLTDAPTKLVTAVVAVRPGTQPLEETPQKMTDMPVEFDPAVPRQATASPTTYVVPTTRPTESNGWGWLGLAGGGSGGVVGFILWRRHLRNRPRNCDLCQHPMVRLDEHEDDVHLNHSEKTEERVGSVDYDVWCCTACPNVVKLRYGAWFTRYARCPRCQATTKSSTSTTQIEATYDHGGQVRVDEACAACGYQNSYTRSTPRTTRPSSSGRSSFGGTSGGGGRSSGRGGGGSW